MKIAYFDCFSGASGDMINGACLDAGLDIEALRASLAGLKVDGYRILAEKVRKQGFAATQFSVQVDASADRPHRHLHHIREIIESGDLSDRVRSQSIDIFTRLAEVEAKAHGTTIEKVHFHEVGAIDAIVDIVGACLGLEMLGVDEVHCSAIPTGSGTVKCEHGTMPVPAPATAALLEGVPIAATDEVGELTTPTGAAILTTLAKSFGPLPAMIIDRIGVGAGQRDGQTRPNILRVLIGQAQEAGEAVDSTPASDEVDEIMVLEANLDDVTGEIIGHTYDRLFKAGALDVYTTAIHMKKNRPGTVLTVLAPPELREKVESILFAETTTFGIRSHLVNRRKLVRSTEEVETEYGTIRIKVGRRQGQVVTASPEYEVCRAVATRVDQPLHDVMDVAMRAWWQRQSDRSAR